MGTRMQLILAAPPEDVTAAQAQALSLEFARRLLGDRFEAVVATHTDHEHIHSHIVFNSVSFADGRMYRDEGYLEAISSFGGVISVTAEDKPRLVFDKFAGGVEEKMKIAEEILTKIYNLTRKIN